MPSPFPGMDPYLEAAPLWAEFHRHFVAAMYQSLLPGLVDSYRARVVCRNYVTELPLFTSIARESHAEEYIEVRSRSDGRLVTVVDAAGPGNKTTPAGGQVRFLPRRHAEAAKAGVVDIDLLTHGERLIAFDRATLGVYDQCVTAVRPSSPGRFEVYTGTIQKKLPKVRVPLAADDRDVVVDLQEVFRRAYDLGQFGGRIDYKADPPAAVVLRPDDRTWVSDWLVHQKLR
jgi:Protein of unknown function (DUF4058)